MYYNKIEMKLHKDAKMKIQSSATLLINEKCEDLIREGKKVYKLGLGKSPFPIPKTVVDTLKKYAKENDYLPIKGLTELREIVAEYFDSKKEHVMIGPGSKELIYLAIKSFEGPILILSPSWVSYIPQAIIAGKKYHQINTSFESEWKIKPDQLKRFSNAMLILNYPSNPTSTTYTETELKEIAKIAQENNIIIISDEIYGGLDYEDNHISMKKIYPEGTILSNGLSKWCAAGGWRLGIMIFPDQLKEIMQTMSGIASETYSSVCTPVQYAAITAYKGNDEITEYKIKTRQILKTLGIRCTDILRKTKIKVHYPKGGFYLFIKFSGLSIKSDKELCSKLLEETGVAILSGSEFGRDEKELTARVAFVNFDGEKALESSDLIDDQFLQKYCSETLEAMEKIVDWTNKIRKKT